MKTVKFGIIGCGLMGREFASAASRWLHVLQDVPRPEIVTVCNRSLPATRWFTEQIPTVRSCCTDYRELLADPDIDAIYCAIPHAQHRQVYVDIIESGKSLLGEKPFGMDRQANQAIVEACRQHPEVFVRCASQFPYYPAAQELIRWVKENRFGRILEVRAGFHHSSDMDLSKPINWKRDIQINGEYGCMGDLGIHVQHIPFRMGWLPHRVYAKLCNYVTERPDRNGGMAPCETWDNATLMCDVTAADGTEFPMTLEMKRMKPGATTDWFLEIDGMNCSAKFSTNDPNALHYTQACGREQAWCRLVIGSKPLFPSITGNIFEFGFSDAILQMWVAFMKELDGQDPGFGCVTPEETVYSHRVLTAALQSQKNHCVVEI